MKLTVPKAAKALGISENAVRQRAKRGHLRTEKKGSRVYVVLSPKDLANTHEEDRGEINAFAAVIDAKDQEIGRMAQQLERAHEEKMELMESLKREQTLHQAVQNVLERQAALPPPRQGFFQRMFGKIEEK